jgi:hypothetical protein
LTYPNGEGSSTEDQGDGPSPDEGAGSDEVVATEIMLSHQRTPTIRIVGTSYCLFSLVILIYFVFARWDWGGSSNWFLYVAVPMLIALLSFLAYIFMRLTTVTLVGDKLVVTGIKKTAEVPVRELVKVTYSWPIIPYVYLKLRSASPLGSAIYFVPRIPLIRHLWFLSRIKDPPEVIRLRGLIWHSQQGQKKEIEDK